MAFGQGSVSLIFLPGIRIIFEGVSKKQDLYDFEQIAGSGDSV